MERDSLPKEKTLRLLEEHFEAIQKQTSAWDFFLNTAEYVRFVETNRQLSESLQKLENQRREALAPLEKLDTQAVKELQKASETITKAVERAHINLEPVARAMEELKRYNAGNILSSLPKVHSLNSHLFDIARGLKDSGMTQIVQRFVDNQKEIKNIHGNFTFSPTLPLRDRAQEEVEVKRQTELWGAWESLPFVARTIFDEEGLDKEIEALCEEDKSKQWDLINYRGVRGELKIMRSQQKPDEALIFFRVPEFRKRIERIQKYFVAELLKDPLTIEPQKLDFEEKTSILSFTGETIIISKKAESAAHDLLRTIFKGRERLWHQDEILDDWKVYTNTPKNKIYQAGLAVNRIIAQETKIKDFLLVTTKTIAINPKYLRT